MSVIILGDVHLGKGTNLGRTNLGSATNSRILDQLNLLNITLEHAIKYNSSHIIITGDVFEDPKPPPNLISSFIDWLKVCEINQVEVHIVVGNHDVLRTSNFYSSPLDIISQAEIANTSIYKNIETLKIGNVSFTFLPFRDRKSLNAIDHDSAIKYISGQLNYETSCISPHLKKVLIGHLAIEGSIYVGDEIDDFSNELFCPISMFSNFDYVFMGHVHKPQVFSNNPYISHIGSMDVSNFGEDHDKYLILFHDNGIFEKIILPTRKLKKLSISIPQDEKDPTSYLISSLSGDLNKAIVKLEISCSAPNQTIDKKKVEDHLKQLGVFNISNFHQTKKLSPIKKEGLLSNKVDVSSAIKIYAKQLPQEYQEDFIKLSQEIFMEMKANDK